MTLEESKFVKAEFRVQRNGITDRVTVELGEELDVEGAESIEVIGIESLKVE